MTEIERIEDQLRRAFAGDAWHGSSLTEILAGVTAEEARAKPIQNAHSIWEIVLHVAAWDGAVGQRLKGETVRTPDEGDWPEVADTSEAAWKDALAKLTMRHEELRETIKRLADKRLDGQLGQERDPPTGGVSVYTTLHGIVQHNVYHAGQIALLKKAWS